MPNPRLLLATLAWLFLWASSAQAIVITDRWPGDLNTITGTVQNNAAQTFTVFEDYNEDNLIPYPSPNGYAVVDQDPGEPVHYFDKIIDLQGEQGFWRFDFEVLNTSPFLWSDYHFEFWDATFTNPIGGILVDVIGDLIFPIDQAMFQPDAIWFFDPQHCANPVNCQAPGQINVYSMILDLTAAQIDFNGSFGIRQIATTPEPASLALMCTCLAGIGFVRRRKARV